MSVTGVALAFVFVVVGMLHMEVLTVSSATAGTIGTICGMLAVMIAGSSTEVEP